MAKRELKNTMVRIDPDQHLELKKAKRQSGRSIQFLVRKAIFTLLETKNFCI